LRRAQQPTLPVPAWLKPALASPPDTLCWYARTDVHALLHSLTALAGWEVPDADSSLDPAALQAAPPASITVRGTVGRGIYRGEVSADVARLHDLFTALTKQMPVHLGGHGNASSPQREP